MLISNGDVGRVLGAGIGGFGGGCDALLWMVSLWRDPKNTFGDEGHALEQHV